MYKRTAPTAYGSAKRQRRTKYGPARPSKSFFTKKGRSQYRAFRPKQIVETKYVDGYIDNTNIVSVNTNDSTWAGTEMNPRQQTAVYGCLPIPRQGTNYCDRDGRKIFVKNIKIRGEILFPASDGLTATFQLPTVRLIVVKDTRTNGVSMSAEDAIGPGLGSDGNSSLSADCALMLMTNPDGWGRFKVLKDKVIRAPVDYTAFHDGVDGALIGVTVPFKMNIKCNCYMNFDASTGAIGSVVDNSFHFLAAQSNTTFTPTISYVARTAFVG